MPGAADQHAAIAIPACSAIHGTVLCQQDRVLVYMEDVGRHNAVDKVAGYMLRHAIPPQDKILYTTGRLTSEW